MNGIYFEYYALNNSQQNILFVLKSLKLAAMDKLAAIDWLPITYILAIFKGFHNSLSVHCMPLATLWKKYTRL